ncbi:DUF1642 domain-containing protein [Streptococcus iners]|uniref:DUF1642 domain-containing protein n=1 Tax=Streptococcus iners TaxID=3028084 RepID=A0AA97A331_9STRE|nr:DUF1642 domain-containing protein [Streptococcus sp. 29887]MCK4025746.1 DUF1642 domain-containing protein [Streptococcus suis]WNY51633.1 DUF1642 domain-containing protein [Streptococcus sp. 29887]
MKKQEALKRIEQMGEYERFVDEPISKASVLNIISQIHEPQKVVVPKYVAEWIDTLDEHGLFGLNYDVVDESVWNWVYKNYDCNVKKLHLAYLYGYEIEREKLYTVEIPGPNCLDVVTFLCKENGKVFIGGDIFWDELPNYNWKKDPDNQLTESEIKQDFEWAWQFAKEVKAENDDQRCPIHTET